MNAEATTPSDRQKTFLTRKNSRSSKVFPKHVQTANIDTLVKTQSSEVQVLTASDMVDRVGVFSESPWRHVLQLERFLHGRFNIFHKSDTKAWPWDA